VSELSAPSCPPTVLEGLERAASLLVLTHGRPDGDGLGSMAALVRAARLSGREAWALVPDKIPQRYEFLFETLGVEEADALQARADACQCIVVLDTASTSQLEEVLPALEARREKLVVIDHHATVEDLSPRMWVDASAAAAGVMVSELLDSLDWPQDEFCREAIMTAVTSDTGWLKFANTDARALRQVARCIDGGVRPDQLYQKLYQVDRPERLGLIIRMLESLELSCQGRLAMLSIRREDFEATGAWPEETENLVNEALRLETVDTAVLLVENGEMIRVSLRSRDLVDVSQIARRFGGGGHARAAGLRSTEPLDPLKERLREACAEALACAE
jgi:phosphoesterase RecJ-like protein